MRVIVHRGLGIAGTRSLVGGECPWSHVPSWWRGEGGDIPGGRCLVEGRYPRGRIDICWGNPTGTDKTGMANKTVMVGKWAVRILLDCFLVSHALDGKFRPNIKKKTL